MKRPEVREQRFNCCDRCKHIEFNYMKPNVCSKHDDFIDKTIMFPVCDDFEELGEVKE